MTKADLSVSRHHEIFSQKYQERFVTIGRNSEDSFFKRLGPRPEHQSRRLLLTLMELSTREVDRRDYTGYGKWLAIDLGDSDLRKRNREELILGNMPT